MKACHVICIESSHGLVFVDRHPLAIRLLTDMNMERKGIHSDAPCARHPSGRRATLESHFKLVPLCTSYQQMPISALDFLVSCRQSVSSHCHRCFPGNNKYIRLHKPSAKMASNLLEIPFRRTQSVNISSAIRNYIESKFDQQPAAFKDDCDTIEQLRESAIHVTEPHTTGVQKLTAYAAQLRYMVSFPNFVSFCRKLV